MCILELFHMGLMVSMQSESPRSKWDILVVVDDFSRYTWVRFLQEKSNVFFFSFLSFLSSSLVWERSECVRIQNDHGRGFKNAQFVVFCSWNPSWLFYLSHHHYRVFERKNKTSNWLVKCYMLNTHHFIYWAEAFIARCLFKTGSVESLCLPFHLVWQYKLTKTLYCLK